MQLSCRPVTVLALLVFLFTSIQHVESKSPSRQAAVKGEGGVPAKQSTLQNRMSFVARTWWRKSTTGKDLSKAQIKTWHEVPYDAKLRNLWEDGTQFDVSVFATDSAARPRSFPTQPLAINDSLIMIPDNTSSSRPALLWRQTSEPQLFCHMFFQKS